MAEFIPDPSNWRDRLVPASFKGVNFYVERDGQTGGRHVAVHEYPKRNAPGFAEDMGRRQRRWAMSAYVIGTNYTDTRDRLITQFETEGGGTLVHPTYGSVQAICLEYNVNEVRERGGIAVFELIMVEIGSSDSILAIVQNSTAQAVASGSALISSSISSAATTIGGLFK